METEEVLLTIKVSYKAGKRPKKAKWRRSGNYYYVANYKRTQYKVDNKAKIKTSNVFFSFSKNPQKKKAMASEHI